MTGKLAYVALVVGDVEAAAAVFQRDFSLARIDCPAGARRVPVFPVGQSALALFAPGDPLVDGETRLGIHHIALRVEDPLAAARTTGIPLVEPVPREGLGGARRVLLSPETTAGVLTYLTEPLNFARTSSGVVERIDHLGVASLGNQAAIEAFAKKLGCPLESAQTDLEVQIAVESFTSDRYGTVYHPRPPEPAHGLRVAFITVGDCELEFLEEFDPATGATVTPGQPGSTRQDQGAIGRFIAARGPGLHHLALKVPDINQTLAALSRAGHTLIDRVGRPGSRRALIAFVHPKSLFGLLLHLVQRDA